MTIKVDLLPTEKKGIGFDPVLIFLLVIVLACVVLFYLYSAWLDNDIAKKKDEVRQWDQKISDVKGDLPKIQKMKEENQKIRNQMEVIRALSNDPIRYGNILYEMAAIMPANVYINSLNVDTGGNTVQISGSAIETSSAKPLETIAKFMTILSTQARYYHDATLSAASSTKVDGQAAFTFQIDTHYDPTKSSKAWDQVQPGGGASATPGSTPSTPNSPAVAPSTPAPQSSAAPESSASPAASGSASPADSSASPAASASASPAK